MMNSDCLGDLDCVILCGGFGTRLRLAVGDSQKVMADVNGKPFLDYLIQHLKAQNIERIILCTGYKSEDVERYYRGTDLGIVIDFAREEDALGTGGAIKNTLPLIESDPFLVLNGDSFCPFKIEDLLNFYTEKDAKILIGASYKDNVCDYGVIEMGDNGGVECFVEKRTKMEGGLVNAGVYLFSQEVLECLPEGKKFSLEKDVFENFIGEGLFCMDTKADFFDIGTPERYAYMKRHFK